jgi:hypothetical protein
VPPDQVAAPDQNAQLEVFEVTLSFSKPSRNRNANRARNSRMKMNEIAFGTTDWSAVSRTEHKGETGVAYWRTRDFAGIRVRMVEYTPGYVADHWCSKGHILLCLEGELDTELKDGRIFTLKPGMSYQVADDAEAHKSRTAVGAKLFIVD